MRATWLVLTVSSLVLCVGLLPASPVQEEDVEASGEVAGLIEAERFVVPYDTVLRITDDTIIQASGDIEINGVILVVDRQPGGQVLDAPMLTVQTPEALIVRGAIIGGRGVAGREGWDGGRGGDGSNINLIASSLHNLGLVKGGPGAPGAAGGGVGGKGGDVVFAGTPRDPEPAPHHDWRAVMSAGAGGPGGGAGGSVRPR